MSDFDLHKRDTLKKIVFGSVALGLYPMKSDAIFEIALPLMIAIVPSIIQAISSFFTNDEQIEFQKQALSEQRINERNQMLSMWLTGAVTNGALSYNVAFDKYLQLANLPLSSNFDGNGTEIAVNNGLFYSSRGGYGSIMSAPETDIASTFHKTEGVVPVPVDYPREVSSKNNSRVIDFISSNTGTNFSDQSLLLSKRDFSQARTPTKGGSDYSVFSAINKKALQQDNKNANLAFFSVPNQALHAIYVPTYSKSYA